MIANLSVYGAPLLATVGVIVLAFALVFLVVRRTMMPEDAQARAVAVGLTAGAAMMIVCGAISAWTFRDADGIERDVGNVLTLASILMCVGVGVRTARLVRRRNLR